MDAINYLNIEYLFLEVYKLLTSHYSGDLPARFLLWLHTFQVLSVLFSLVLMMGIAYATIRYYQIWKEEEEERMGPLHAAQAHADTNPKWERIISQAASEHPNDWRQAILEADILLGELLTSLGYQGEGIGEQLKSIERGDFPTLDLAWDAHKVRNQIAHEGSDFLLTQREAKRAIDLYRRVFESFHFI